MPRRKLVWARNSFEATVSNAVPPALDPPTRVDLINRFETSYGASSLGFTVVRIRGYITPLNRTATEPVAYRATCYVGDNNDIARAPNANDNAFDSLSENRDYFFFEPFFIPGTVATNVTLFTDGSRIHSREIDVRSSRKVEELNQAVIFDLSAAGLGAAGDVAAFYVDLSVLLMLP